MESIYNILKEVKNGSPELRQNFIENNKDFIIRVVGNAFGKSAIVKNSDEFNLGISAFNYSIDNFNIEAHGDFFEYAEKNIKKWARDMLIRNAQGTSQNNFSYNESCYDKNCELSEELSIFKNALWKYGITMKDLISSTPKSSYLIMRAVRLAKDLSKSNEFTRNLVYSSKIELSYVEKDNTDRKILKQNYKYIVALCLIMKSKLEVTKGYIKNVDLSWNLSEYAGVVLEIKGNKAIIMTEDCRFLCIKKPFNTSIGNEVNYKNYYTPKSKFSHIKNKALAGCLAAAALFMILVFIMFIQSSDKKQNMVLSENSSRSDSSLDNNDNNQPKDISDESSNSLLADSSSGTATSSKSVGNAKNDNSKSNKKSKASTPKPIDKMSLPAVNSPGVKKTPGNAKDYPTKGIKPGANKSSPTKSTASTKPTNSPDKLSIASPPHTEQSDHITVIRATGEPGNVTISSDKHTVKVGEDFTIISIMTGGNNGTEWLLLENGKVISTLKRVDNTPDSQTVMRIITAEKTGTYTYRCAFVNSFGRTESPSIEVIVSN
ncbi:anti-sigma factor domain-containing protein [Pseudobacteroides cellulosolvens]|uniref:Anti-sigma factor RsgI, N-terminal n=1 Tax=Pseudobacteroides cellulosolvens ATCC 35603 = DSM 2933 TaxID=398512 RepID=A0A0L6JTW1_9FIRM|nr:anti-sigma factor domain-containing protein [Pseudobacteroides cellulosolvens]KNY29276.1 Anti-sigma factor RsgI, N-terminal [Pseudobacteroides cellulosolvens ATCC 35603 = DSM 2933]